MKEQLEKRNVDITYYDCDNSAGIIDFPNLKHDLARAGISTYGMYPSDEVQKSNVHLKPALSLISHITFVKEVEAGTPISYGGTFVAPEKMKLPRSRSDTETDIHVLFLIKAVCLSEESGQKS